MIHGVLAAYPGWLIKQSADNKLTADLDYAQPRLLCQFPVPHVVTLDIALENRALTIETTVTATTPASGAMCFGFHPYLTVPGVPRSGGSWRRRRCVICPWTTGASRPAPARTGPSDVGTLGRQDFRRRVR